MAHSLGKSDIFENVFPDSKTESADGGSSSYRRDDRPRGGYDGDHRSYQSRDSRDYNRDRYPPRNEERRAPPPSMADSNDNWRSKTSSEPASQESEENREGGYRRNYGGYGRSRDGYHDDRPRGNYGDRPRYNDNEDRPPRREGEGGEGDDQGQRPSRDGYREYRPPRRNYDDRPRDGGRDRGYGDRDRGYGDRDRNYGDRDRDRGYGDRDRGYGDRDRNYGDRDRDGGRRSYGDRDGGRDGYPRRNYGPDASSTSAPAAEGTSTASTTRPVIQPKVLDASAAPSTAVAPAVDPALSNLSVDELRAIATEKRRLEEEKIKQDLKERDEKLQAAKSGATASSSGGRFAHLSTQPTSAPSQEMIQPRTMGGERGNDRVSGGSSSGAPSKPMPNVPLGSSIQPKEIECSFDSTGFGPIFYESISQPNIYRLTNSISAVFTNNDCKDVLDTLRRVSTQSECVMVINRLLSQLLEQQPTERFEKMMMIVSGVLSSIDISVEFIEQAVQLTYQSLYKITHPQVTQYFEQIVNQLAKSKLIHHFPCYSNESYERVKALSNVQNEIDEAAEVANEKEQDKSKVFGQLFQLSERGVALSAKCKELNLPKDPDVLYYLLHFLYKASDNNAMSMVRSIKDGNYVTQLSTKLWGQVVVDMFDNEDMSMHSQVLDGASRFCLEVNAPKEFVNALFYSIFSFDLVYGDTFDYWRNNFKISSENERQFMGGLSSTIMKIIDELRAQGEEEEEEE